MLVHPKSVGYMKLKSKNPFHWPKFYPSYFTDKYNDDIKTFIAAIREVNRIIKQPALQKYEATLYDKPVPGNSYTHSVIESLKLSIPVKSFHKDGTKVCK